MEISPIGSGAVLGKCVFYMLEIKELKEKHRQELEDETYHVAKKEEMGKVELERVAL